MKIGCFALVEPFTPMERQFELIRGMGIEYVDLTDNHDGASLGVEFGFAASVSLDSNPAKIRQLAAKHKLKLSTVCAHANLLDPTAPDVYGTLQIIKAIRLAAQLGIPEVITTEGDPKTKFGHALTEKERIFTICEKLQSPIEWAEELGVKLLLEPHGIVTDSVKLMGNLLAELGHEKTVGICLDTGNSWLGGAEPLEFVKTFGRRIQHVHWKDMPESWLPKHGKIYGCGMAAIPLGDGVVGIPAIVKALKKTGFNGTTTLEIAGAENMKLSSQRLHQWS
ncbi:MAG: sugar phosphate isomerase/epimerase [Verrucomicrobiota bacterium]